MTAGAREPLILLVEDDPGLASMLIDWFSARHYGVCHVDSASEAETVVDKIQPDLVVLDLMLPDRNGLTMCSQLKRLTRAAVIICSATRRKDDAVIGLQLGADDFLRKPFAVEELQARVDLALGRASASRPQTLSAARPLHQFGSLSIDVSACTATSDGEPLPLTPTEFRLLSALTSGATRVVPTHELADGVWGAVDDGVVHSLAVHMRRLRARLACAAPRMRLVTRRGFGYQLVDTAAPAAGG